MKKIALLIVILCANTLYSMKRSASEHYVESDTGSELKPEIWGQEQLPEDVRMLIMTALAQSGNDLDEAINNIKKVSKLNKTFNQIINVVYGDVGNLKGFTQLVHILADKFGMPTSIVAEKFGTPVAKEYNELGRQLLMSTYDCWTFSSIKNIEKYIKDGADVNYSSPSTIVYNNLSGIETPMFFAMRLRELEVIRLLLDSGATLESDEYYDTYDYWMPSHKSEIKQLFDEVRARQ